MFKQCPRCGGDVDASYSEDVHCLQCGNRPEVEYPGPVIVGAGGSATGRRLGDRLSWAGDRHSDASRDSGQARPQETGVLQKLRSWDGAPTHASELEGVCPRCGAVESVMLEKVRPDYNTCFRCRRCSHVYSP